MPTAISGRDVRRIRNQLGLSQLQFSALIRVTPTSISRWEGDKVVPEGYGEIVIGLMKDLPLRKVDIEETKKRIRMTDDRLQIVKLLCRMLIDNGIPLDGDTPAAAR